MEGEVGYFRRNHWVPVPQAIDIADLNRQLIASCREDELRTTAGREQSVGAGLIVEREHLLPLAAEEMDLVQTSFPTVNSLGCAKVLTNAYSAPLKAGTEVHAKVYAGWVELWHDGPLCGSPRAMLPAPAASSRHGTLLCSIASRVGNIQPALTAES